MRLRPEDAKRLPWVRRASKSVRCSAHLWGKMDLDLIGKPGYVESFRCKRSAVWHFRALPKSFADDGVYCWTHLKSEGLYGDPVEIARFEQWLRKHTEEEKCATVASMTF